jgi:hypothetical protein
MFELVLMPAYSGFSVLYLTVALSWWFDRRFDGVVTSAYTLPLAVALTAMAGAYAVFGAGERGMLPVSVADPLGVACLAACLISGLLAATIHWFDRPRFLVPRRHRPRPGELSGRRQRTQSPRRTGRQKPPRA